MYSIFLEDWLRIFPRSHIYVMRYEDYATDMLKEINKIYAFLHLGQRDTLLKLLHRKQIIITCFQLLYKKKDTHTHTLDTTLPLYVLQSILISQ